METLFEIIFEFIIIGIFVIPGAFYRWLISRLWKSNKSFSDFKNEDAYINGIVGLLITTGVILSLIHLLKS